MKPLQHMWNDIRRGENIDLYVTVVSAILLAALNVIGLAPQNWLPPLNLALLALLAFSILGNRHRLESINRKLSQNLEDVLRKKWPENELSAKTNKSKNILLIGVSLSRTIRTYLSILSENLQQGASIRVLLVDPNSPSAEIAANRLPESINIERTRNDIENTLITLESIKEKRGGIEIRTINNPMSFGGILLDIDTPHGIMYLEYYSFKMTDEDIPKLILKPNDEFWYEHFASQAEKLWSNANNYIAKNSEG